MKNENLYIVLLGGKHAQARVEVHDVIPVIANQLTDQYQNLHSQWFGLSKGLHIDGWMKIHGVRYQQTDYCIEISDVAPINPTLKLYLINLGAYLPEQFGEIHKYIVVAGCDKADAKQQGKLAIEPHWFKAHTDAVIDIDDCICLDMFDQKYIHLVEGKYPANEFKNDYVLI